jgi:hypothetical protein
MLFPQQPIEVSVRDALLTDMSFLDHYLVARRGEELPGTDQTPQTLASRRGSLLATNTTEPPLILDDAGNQQQQQQQMLQCNSSRKTFSSPGQGSFIHTPRRSSLNGSPSVAASSAGRRRASLYLHRTHLQQIGAGPVDVLPLPIANDEREAEKS